MQDLKQLKAKIKHGHTIQLSSSFTKFGAIFGFVLAVLAAFFLVPMVLNNPEGVTADNVIGDLLLLLVLFAAFYQFIFAAEAELTGKNLKLKKVTGKEYEVDVNQVVKIYSFRTKRTKHTIVKFLDNDRNLQKVLILNPSSFIFGEEVSPGEVIKLAQQIYITRRKKKENEPIEKIIKYTGLTEDEINEI